jgi:hypothetical protein
MDASLPITTSFKQEKALVAEVQKRTSATKAFSTERNNR